ncbi:MAG: hypothetical protein RLZZ511_4159 [Cyanobacteriota bacterium]|jgi:uncharacterized membrane protein (UPF0182 family)
MKKPSKILVLVEHHSKLFFATLLILVALVITSKPLAHLLTEIWWFDSVGFAAVFWTKLGWQILIGLVTCITYGCVLLGNYRIAIHNTRKQPFRLFDDRLPSSESDREPEILSERGIHASVIILTVVWSIMAAFNIAANWETVLKFFNASLIGEIDPILHQDLSFYLFQLPLYEAFYAWLMFPVGIALIVAVLIYLVKGALERDQRGRLHIQQPAKQHLSLLLCLILILVGWGFWLARSKLLYGTGGTVFGVGYADHFAKLLSYQVSSFLAVALGFLYLLLMRRRNFGLELKALGVMIVALILLQDFYPWFVQQFLVAPNELTKEKEYLAHNIKFTQAAYRLNSIQQEKYQASAKLTRQSLQNNQPTIQNIRLWDYRPLLSTYRQLQEIRSYYKFSDVDIDRYTLNGDYQQVMLSAREMSHEQLPIEAQNWVNKRLKYTHGYGFVMSPVNQITADGLPEFYVKDIPPASTVDLPIQETAIYYGEESHNYVFTGMTTDEFDYPVGSTNASVRYQGKGGVAIGSLGRRLVYAYELNSLQALVSNYFAPTSRIHYHRQIRDRVSRVAPFLKFDHDPYLVVADGRLQWIIDAYTTSDHYPYSQPVRTSKDASNILQKDSTRSLSDNNLNYIRNSVKIVVDAYDGSTRFFAVDPDDPVLATYRKIFPTLFEPATAAPKTIQQHFRYPQDLFKIQMQMYLNYHMSDPEVFYNREDQWQFPKQIYEDKDVLLEPYYIIMRLPGASKLEFLMIQPFTPANKENMISWVAARSNGDDYGKLLLYEFPKQSLVFGPRQIEARIDQEPQISQQFTLWNQSGSKVIRGDLLVIPIDQSLLYVEPIYLRAEQSELPALKRVIVAYDKSVVMEKTLDEALATIFGDKPATTTANPELAVKDPPKKPANPQKAQLAKVALETYRKAQAALRQGNWAEYGRQQQELEKALQQLGQL